MRITRKAFLRQVLAGGILSGPAARALAGARPDPAQPPLVRRTGTTLACVRALPSELRLWRDPATGLRVKVLAASAGRDEKIYPTHPSWTADGRWIVFFSDRTGEAQLHAVDPGEGTLLELTREEGLAWGQACLARDRNAVYVVAGRKILALDLAPARGGPPARTEIAALPEGSRLAGGMSLDAGGGTLYAGLAWSGGEGRSTIHALGLRTGAWREVIRVPFRVGHVQANPVLGGWILYCHETGGDAPQRTWIVRADGSANGAFWKERDEAWATHEVWWGADRVILTLWRWRGLRDPDLYGMAAVDRRTRALRIIDRFPYWHVAGSPDGRWAVGDTMAGEIYAVDAATGRRRLLTAGHRPNAGAAHPHPSIALDGRAVLFNSSRWGREDLCLLEVPRKAGRFP